MLGLWALKRWLPRWPRALIVLVAAGISGFVLGLEAQGVATVGLAPAGLPRPAFPVVDVATLRSLIIPALTIAFVCFMESISVAKRLAEGTPHRIAANRELVALGFANIASGLFHGYPIAGGFSRSAVNADAGARTRMAGVFTALFVAASLTWLTDALASVPQAALGAIIVMAVGGLVDTAEPRRLWQIKRLDLGMLIVTFLATLSLGIQQGVLSGVGLSLVVMAVRTTRPHTAVLGRLPGTQVYRNVLRFPDAVTLPSILIVRLDAQLYFGNVSFLRDSLERLEAEHNASAATQPLEAVIIDGSGINHLDSSAERALATLHHAYAERGIVLLMANVKGPVRDVLERSGLAEALGGQRMAFHVHDAVLRLEATGGGGPAQSKSTNARET
jgi:SulP family sulfate permease